MVVLFVEKDYSILINLCLDSSSFDNISCMLTDQ